MDIKKPDRVKKEIWQQHLSWFDVVSEGQLTPPPVVKGEKSKGSAKEKSKKN